MQIRRRKETGAWEVVVNHGGNEVRRSSRKWTRADAREAGELILAQLKRGNKPQPRTLADGVEKWLDEYSIHLKSHKENCHHTRAILPFIDRPIEEGPVVANEIKQAMRHLRPATVNNRLAIVRRVLNLAFSEWGWIDVPLGKKVKLLPPNNQKSKFMTREQVQAIIDACGNAHAGKLIRLAAYTGIRKGKLLSLSRHDVVDGCIYLGNDKNGLPHVVPLHSSVREIADELPLPISLAQLRDAWDRGRTAAGCEEFTWHDLRHAFASWIINDRSDLYKVQKLLNHSNIKVTERYAHLLNKNLKDAIDTL